MCVSCYLTLLLAPLTSKLGLPHLLFLLFIPMVRLIRYTLSDQSSKIAAYISTVVYGILGVSGILCVTFKKYGLAKNFSTLWWVVTIAVTLLAICDLIFVGVSSKDYIRSVCQQELLLTDKYSSGNVDAGQLSDDVDSCYRTVVMTGGIVLAVQLLVMSLCGWVASRYTSEVKHQHDVDQQQVGYAETYVQKA